MKISMKAKFRKRIFRYICSTLFASGIILSTFLSSTVKAADVHSYPTVAVMQFGNKAITSQGLRKYDFDSASEYAIYQLLASGWFDLVDYEQLSNIAKMHEINMSGLVDQSTAVQLGKFAGAQFMVVQYRRKVFSDKMSQYTKDIFVRICSPYNITLEEWNHDQDHVHIMFRAHPNTEISKFINTYKSASSRLIKKDFSEVRG